MQVKKIIEPAVTAIKATVHPNVPIGKEGMIRKKIKYAKGKALRYENNACNYQPPGF